MARMQGEEMTDAAAVYAGCDVSKDWLDVALPDGCDRGRMLRLANAARGHADLVREARKAGVTRVALEPTGRLHLDLWQALDRAGIGVVPVNPARARAYAGAAGRMAKTDRIDARSLAEMAARFALAPEPPPSEEVMQIRELQHFRQGLARQAASLKNQLAAARSPLLRQLIAQAGRQIARLIAQTEAKIDALIAADPAHARRAAILVSIPGIGPAATRALIADLPELGQASDKEIAALAGCAPYARDSGSHTGRRRTGHGRTHLRSALHMAAVSAATHNPAVKPLARRLKGAGKHGLVIVTAALRKLLTIANALVRDDRLWTKERP